MFSDHPSNPEYEDDDGIDVQDHWSHAVSGSAGVGGDGLVAADATESTTSHGALGGTAARPTTTAGGGGASGGAADSVGIATTAMPTGCGTGVQDQWMDVSQEFLARWLDLLSGHGDLVGFHAFSDICTVGGKEDLVDILAAFATI